MKTVLITGGSGFIGSHVADKLTEKGFKVIVFDKKVITLKINCLLEEIF